MTDVPWRDSVLDKPLPIHSGHFRLGEEPGLGFDLVEHELDQHPGLTKARPGYYI